MTAFITVIDDDGVTKLYENEGIMPEGYSIDFTKEIPTKITTFNFKVVQLLEKNTEMKELNNPQVWKLAEGEKEEEITQYNTPEAIFGDYFHGELWVKCPHCGKGKEIIGATPVKEVGGYKIYKCGSCGKYFKKC